MLRTRHLTFLTVAATFILMAPAAYAQSVDEAGAQKLATQLKEGLAAYPLFQTSGDVTVTADGDAYKVTIPTLTKAHEDMTVVLAPIDLRMTPVTDVEYSYEGRLATPFATITDATGVPEATISAGEQTLTGSWNMAMQSYPTTNLRLGQLSVKNDKQVEIATIASMGVVGSNVVTSPKKMDSEVNLFLNGLKIADPARPTSTGQIGEINMVAKMTGLDMTSMEKAREEIQKLENTDAPPGALLQQVLKSFADMPTAGSSGNSVINVSLKGLDFKDTGAEPFTVLIPGMNLMMGGGDSGNQLGAFSFTYDHSGMVINTGDKLVDDMIPSIMKIDTALTNVPLAAMLGSAAAEGAKALDQPAKEISPEAIGTDIWGTMRKQMADAGTTVTIRDISYTAPALSSVSTGSFKAHAESFIGAVGTLDTRINGMEELIARLTQVMSEPSKAGPEAQPNADLQGLMMGLGMAQSFGKKIEGQTPSAYEYKIVLTPAGGFTLNGMDLGGLMGAMAPPAPAPAVPE